MPSIEEILASLSEEPETADGDDNDTSEPKDNKTIKAIRDHAKKLERELSKAAKELGELREFKSTVTREKTQEQVTAAFKEAGIEDRFAKLFLRVQGDEPVTAESISSFVQEYGLADEGKVPPGGGGFAPTPGGEPANKATISRDDFDKLARENPAKAQEYLRRGAVQWRNLPNPN